MGAGCSIDGPDTPPTGFHQQTIAIRAKRESQPQPQPQQYGRRADEPPRTVALTRIWNSTTCGEMVKGQSLITLDQYETVLSASKLLDTKRISSAPVIDTKTQKPIAMFDYRDLTSFLIMANNHSMQQLAESGGFGVKNTTTGPDIKADQSTQRPEHHDSGSTSQQTWHSPSSLPGTPAQSTPRPDTDRSNASTPPPGTISHVPRGSLAAKSGHNNPLLLISALKASTHAALDRTRSTEKQLHETTTPKSEGIHKYLHFLDLKDALTGMVANLSGSNPLHTVSVVTPLYGAVQLMCGYNDVPVRALVVVNKTGNMMGMVSQSACLRFMYEKLTSPGAEKTMPSLVDFMKGSLRDLGLCNRRPPTISWKATVIQAFTYMNEKKKQSLAIINDENGVLVGTISISDIKYLWNSKELLLTLQRPVSVFVNVIRASATYWHVNLDSSSPATAMSTSYTAHTDQSLNDTINMMLTKRIHRVWLVNKQDKPVGILSMTDILRVLMPPPIEKVTKKNDHHTRALSHAPTRPRQTSAPHTHHHPRIKVDTLHESKHTNVPSKYLMNEKDEYEDERMENVPQIRRKSDGWTAGLAKT